MQDFIQTSGYHYHTALLTFFIILIILTIFLLIQGIRDKTVTRILWFMIGIIYVLISFFTFHEVKDTYSEYEGKFKVVESSADRIYSNSDENGSIVVTDKDGNKQQFEIVGNKIYKKGDIVKIKINVTKGYKPTLKNNINNNFIDTLSTGAKQYLVNIEKVK